MSEVAATTSTGGEQPVADLQLDSITDGQNARGIPIVKFLDDISEFCQTFDPPASAELLIGAYSDLFAKFKSYEGSLTQKRKSIVASGNQKLLHCMKSIN